MEGDMSDRTRSALVAAVILSSLLAGSAHAADRAATCRATKMLRAGVYGLCLLKANAHAAKTGGTPDLASCAAKFTKAWSTAEAHAGGACPTAGDASTIGGQVLIDVAAIVTALTPSASTTTTTVTGSACGGAIYPGCGGTCPPGDSCWAYGSMPLTCTCLPSTSTPCADSGGFAPGAATCGGVCPSGEVCTTLRIDDSSLSR